MSIDSSDPIIVDEPPDDDVEIGESPDGDRIGGDQARWLLANRRDVLKAAGTLAVFAAIAEGSLNGGGSGANLYGGTMALDKAYKIGPRTYMGPDNLKDNVISDIPDSEGWKYEAVDAEVAYWLDNDAWQGPLGLGSSGTKAGPIHTSEVTTERLSNESAPVSFDVFTDGTDIWAIPQNNPSDSVDLSEVTGTDIGTVLDKLMYDELPPQGTKTEGRGRINLKAANYPGKLSNGQADGLRPPAQCVIAGEVSSHDEVGSSSPDTNPTTQPPVQLETDSVGLAQLNVDQKFLIGARVQDIEIIGPGAADNGSVGVQLSGSNLFDWSHFDRLHFQEFDQMFDTVASNLAQVFFYGCQFRNFNGTGKVLGDRVYFDKCVFPIADGAQIIFEDVNLNNCELHIVGEANDAGAHFQGGVVADNLRIAKFGTTNTSGTAVKIVGGTVMVDQVTVGLESASGGFTNVFNVTGGSDHSIRTIRDGTSSTWHVTVNGGDDCVVEDVAVGKARHLGGARPVWDNIIFGGPFGGTDIGSLTGASEGDRARADGTDASASADELFILKSNGDWQSIADPSTTITPA